ncbi:MAG: hypothetical protein AAB649_02935 [Patescibacteria group bacterium]
MHADSVIYKTGELISAECGEYSDHRVLGVFRVTKDFKPKDYLADYLSVHPEQTKQYRFEKSVFLAKLVVAGLLEEVDCRPMYLGSYSSANEVSF